MFLLRKSLKLWYLGMPVWLNFDHTRRRAGGKSIKFQNNGTGTGTGTI